MKPKKCKACGEQFYPFQTTQKVCSMECAVKLINEKNRKEYDKETRRLKEKTKTRSQWMKEAQAAFNAYVRKRDEREVCISCGRNHQGKWDAGHYRTTKAAPELRFHPLNNHKQCQPCNRHLSGNITEYRLALLSKIGEDLVEWLEGPHQAQKWTVLDLKEIKAYYKEQTKLLEKS